MMAKILISLPDKLAARFRAAIPPRKRSEVIRFLLEKEIMNREKQLYESALAVENDEQLNKEMADWDITTDHGLDYDGSW